MVLCYFNSDRIRPKKKKTTRDSGYADGTVTHPVVVSAVYIPGHTKVPNFHQEVLTNQAITGGQVSVHKVLGCQVDHACSNLLSNVQHLRLGQLCWRVTLSHKYSIRSMCPEKT